MSGDQAWRLVEARLLDVRRNHATCLVEWVYEDPGYDAGELSKALAEMGLNVYSAFTEGHRAMGLGAHDLAGVASGRLHLHPPEAWPAFVQQVAVAAL